MLKYLFFPFEMALLLYESILRIPAQSAQPYIIHDKVNAFHFIFMCVYIKPSAYQITYYIDNSFSMPLLALYTKYEAEITESGCIAHKERLHRSHASYSVFGIRLLLQQRRKPM